MKGAAARALCEIFHKQERFSLFLSMVKMRQENSRLRISPLLRVYGMIYSKLLFFWLVP